MKKKRNKKTRKLKSPQIDAPGLLSVGYIIIQFSRTPVYAACSYICGVQYTIHTHAQNS